MGTLAARGINFPSTPKTKLTAQKSSTTKGTGEISSKTGKLCASYPQFIEGMIHKFLNATTFDGYNPYRVTKGGFDWETIEPDNPWAYIGYWGDHQIIYLLKFLEFIEDHYLVS